LIFSSSDIFTVLAGQVRNLHVPGIKYNHVSLIRRFRSVKLHVLHVYVGLYTFYVSI
jgi:hypothetical protein